MVGKTYFYQAGSYGGRMEILRKPPCAKIYGGSNHARHPFGEHRVSVYAKQNMEKYSITDSETGMREHQRTSGCSYYTTF